LAWEALGITNRRLNHLAPRDYALLQLMLWRGQKGVETADILGDAIYRHLGTKQYIIARLRVASRVDADTTLRKFLPVPAAQQAYRAAL
jgi:hypothetical protein